MNGICTTVTVAGQPEEVAQPDGLQAVLVAMLMLVLMAALEEGGALW